MTECRKRQNEKYKGTPQQRCISKKSQHYLEIIDTNVCESCPVRDFKKKKAPCREKPIPVVHSMPKLKRQHEGYPECPYRYEGVSGLTCQITNLPVTPEICERCDKETREAEAHLGDKVVNFLGSIRKWVKMGRPTRSEEEIKELFETHCNAKPEPCDRYDPEKKGCKTCGCRVSTDVTPLRNKLAMATEHCPLGRF